MEQQQLIDEVVEELKHRIQLADTQSKKMSTVIVIGNLSAIEKKTLETVYKVLPFTNNEVSYHKIVIAKMSKNLMAQIALASPQSPESDFILTALLLGKQVYVMEDGFCYRNFKETAYKTLYNHYQQYESKILQFGIQLISHTSQLLDDKNETLLEGDADLVVDFTKKRLLLESDFIKIQKNGIVTVRLSKNCIITPLAQDYMKNHSIMVKREAKR